MFRSVKCEIKSINLFFFTFCTKKTFDFPVRKDCGGVGPRHRAVSPSGVHQHDDPRHRIHAHRRHVRSRMHPLLFRAKRSGQFR